MDNAYNANGLMFWNTHELDFRDYLIRTIPPHVETILIGENRQWVMGRVETPVIIPADLVNPNYTHHDVFHLEDPLGGAPEFALRPETTAGTYEIMRKLLREQAATAPFCVWQVGKSFRREQDQPSKYMRLKEFNQLEFQCLYSEGTKNDYQQAMLEPLTKMVSLILGREARTVDSDRLPSYSVRTVDIEVNTGERWMEVCSISLRTDFPDLLRFGTNKGSVEKKAFVLEIAFGIDRLVYLKMEAARG